MSVLVSEMATAALARARLNERMVRAAMHARDAKGDEQDPDEKRIASFFRTAMKTAMEVVFVTGTCDVRVADLDRHNREWFQSLCMEAGVIFGTSKTPSVFMQEFGMFLDEILARRNNRQGKTQTAA